MTHPRTDDPGIDWESHDWNAMYAGDGRDTGPMDDALLAEILARPAGRALDLGCGAGGNAIGLALRGWSVTGVDGASRAIKSARISAESAGVDIRWFVDDLTTWRTDGTFDAVVSCFALPPTGPGRDAALHMAVAALAPSGVLAVTDWDGASMSWGRPADFTSVEELVAAVDGLELLRAESVETAPHNHGDHGSEHGDHGTHTDQPVPARPQKAVTVVARRAAS